jgi:uncharacterized caspase-like protein
MLSRLASFLSLVVAAAIAVTFSVAGAHAAPDRRVALVIGNAAYQNVPPLANPLSDAKAVSASLKRLGFEVVEGYDLKIDGMRSLVGEFAAKLDGAKAALVFYAGHGIAVGDENFLLPTDAVLKSEADLDFRTVNVNLVLRQMQREERVNVLILDACRDNPFAKELARSVGKTRSTSISTGLTAIDTQASSGILIAFATDPRSVALDGTSGRNSPFTAALLKHIETPGVSISTVMDRVREDVWTSTDKKQKPWVNTSIIGEFMLNPSAPASGGVKQAALPPAGGAAPTGVGAGSGLDRAQMDVRMWETAEKSNTLEDYQAYLDSFPTGQFAAFAKNRIARLKSEAGGNQVASLPEAELKEPGTLQTETALRLTDNDRREVQNRLRATGFMVLPATGKFGPATRESLSRWQAANNLPTTGFLTNAQKQVLWTKSEAAYRELLAAAPPVQAAPVTRNVRQSQPVQDDGAEAAPRRRAPQRQQAEQPQQQRAPTAGEIGVMMGGAGSLLQGIGALRR